MIHFWRMIQWVVTRKNAIALTLAVIALISLWYAAFSGVGE